LRAAHAALKPGGVLAIWSSAPHAEFAARLRKTKFRGEGNRGARQGPARRRGNI